MKNTASAECFTLEKANISVFLVKIGNFVNGKRNGEGMFTYNNKDIYSGNWKNGKKHG